MNKNKTIMIWRRFFLWQLCCLHYVHAIIVIARQFRPKRARRARRWNWWLWRIRMCMWVKPRNSLILCSEALNPVWLCLRANSILWISPRHRLRIRRCFITTAMCCCSTLIPTTRTRCICILTNMPPRRWWWISPPRTAHRCGSCWKSMKARYLTSFIKQSTAAYIKPLRALRVMIWTRQSATSLDSDWCFRTNLPLPRRIKTLPGCARRPRISV